MSQDHAASTKIAQDAAVSRVLAETAVALWFQMECFRGMFASAPDHVKIMLGSQLFQQYCDNRATQAEAQLRLLLSIRRQARQAQRESLLGAGGSGLAADRSPPPSS